MRFTSSAVVACLLCGCNLFSSTESASSAADMGGSGADAGSIADVGVDVGAFDLGLDQGDPTDLGPPVCGDGVVSGDEACDGTADSCAALGFDGGESVCAADCTVDTSACVACDFYIALASGAATDATSAQAPGDLGVLRQVLGGGASAGARVCLLRGEVAELTAPIEWTTGGNAGSSVLLTTYGDPAAPLPTFSAFVDFPRPRWTELGDGRFVTAVDSPVYNVWVGNAQQGSEASSEALDDGEWFYDGADLYLRPLSGRISTPVSVVFVDDMFVIGGSNVQMQGIGFAIGAGAVRVEGASDVTLSGLVAQQLLRGVDVVDAQNISVEQSQFVGGVGVRANGALAARANEFAGASVGIDLTNPTGALISDNVFSNGEVAVRLTGTVAGTSDNAIERNLFSDFERGVELTAVAPYVGANNVVSQNIFESVGTAISSQGCAVDSVQILHNTIVGTQDASIEVVSNCGAVIKNNASESAASHVRLSDAYLDASETAAVTADSNLYVGTTDTAWAGGDWSVWQAGGYGANSQVVSDAGFVGGMAPEGYQPAPASPLIDAAEEVGITEDFGGRPRPVNAPDIGAWEAQ